MSLRVNVILREIRQFIGNMERIKYAGNYFLDKIEVLAGRRRIFKLNLSDPCSEK